MEERERCYSFSPTTRDLKLEKGFSDTKDTKWSRKIASEVTRTIFITPSFRVVYHYSHSSNGSDIQAFLIRQVETVRRNTSYFIISQSLYNPSHYKLHVRYCRDFLTRITIKIGQQIYTSIKIKL
jgi:hypothetical protein